MDNCQGVELAYAGFWVRTWAAVLDTLLLLITTFPLLLAIYGTQYLDSLHLVHGPMDILISFVFPVVVVIAFWVYRSATPGKMVISSVIVDAKTGCRPTLRQCVVRYLGYYLATLPLGLGLLWVAFDGKKQGWHDKLAGTVVVRKIFRPHQISVDAFNR